MRIVLVFYAQCSYNVLLVYNNILLQEKNNVIVRLALITLL